MRTAFTIQGPQMNLHNERIADQRLRSFPVVDRNQKPATLRDKVVGTIGVLLGLAWVAIMLYPWFIA